MSEDAYPTDGELRELSAFDWSEPDVFSRARQERLLLQAQALWWPDDSCFTRHGDHFLVSTVGWSGNESIVAALRGNTPFWMRCWESSRRGGHHIFKVPAQDKRGTS